MAALTWNPDASSSLDLTVAIFPDTESAHEGLEAVRAYAGTDTILNGAVITKDDNGNTAVRELDDVGPGRGVLFGVITGGMIGLMAGPVGALIGAAAGAVTGGVSADLIDFGFPNEYLDQVKIKMHPSASALVLLTEQHISQSLVAALEPFGGEIFRHALDDAAVARIEGYT